MLFVCVSVYSYVYGCCLVYFRCTPWTGAPMGNGWPVEAKTKSSKCKHPSKQVVDFLCSMPGNKRTPTSESEKLEGQLFLFTVTITWASGKG